MSRAVLQGARPPLALQHRGSVTAGIKSGGVYPSSFPLACFRVSSNNNVLLMLCAWCSVSVSVCICVARAPRPFLQSFRKHLPSPQVQCGVPRRRWSSVALRSSCAVCQTLELCQGFAAARARVHVQRSGAGSKHSSKCSNVHHLPPSQQLPAVSLKGCKLMRARASMAK